MDSNYKEKNLKEVTLAERHELYNLMNLYKYLHSTEDAVASDEELDSVWQSMMEDKNTYVLCIRDGDELVSSCTLAIVRNLTRGAKPYGVIENVVTHSDYRKMGYGTKVLNKAVEIALERNCYKVMLMTGRKDESTLRFYEKAGFERGTKTGFVRYFDKQIQFER